MELSPPTAPAPGAPLGRRERERLARRQAMLSAALAVFSEKGFDGATIDEVAERAEFGKGTIYNYFPGGKEELYFALFEEVVAGGLYGVIERLAPDDAEVRTAAGVRAGFNRLIAGIVEHFLANRNVLLLFMKDGHRVMFQPETRTRLADQFARITDALAHPIEAAIAAGTLRPLPARPVAHMIMGNVRGVIMARLDSHGRPACDAPALALDAPQDVADFITTVLFDGLLVSEGPAPDA